MSSEAVCSHCGLAFVVPDELREAWAACPRCHERVVNPAALRRSHAPLTLPGCLGGVFVLAGVLGGHVWLLAAVPASLLIICGDLAPVEPLVIGFFIWVCVLVGGVLLTRAGELRPDRLLMWLGGVAALLAALALGAAAGVFAVFTSRF